MASLDNHDMLGIDKKGKKVCVVLKCDTRASRIPIDKADENFGLVSYCAPCASALRSGATTTKTKWEQGKKKLAVSMVDNRTASAAELQSEISRHLMADEAAKLEAKQLKHRGIQHMMEQRLQVMSDLTERLVEANVQMAADMAAASTKQMEVMAKATATQQHTQAKFREAAAAGSRCAQPCARSSVAGAPCSSAGAAAVVHVQRKTPAPGGSLRESTSETEGVCARRAVLSKGGLRCLRLPNRVAEHAVHAARRLRGLSAVPGGGGRPGGAVLRERAWPVVLPTAVHQRGRNRAQACEGMLDRRARSGRWRAAGRADLEVRR